MAETATASAVAAQCPPQNENSNTSMLQEFEVQLTQEQQYVINNHLPRGFSLQFASQQTRRMQAAAAAAKKDGESAATAQVKTSMQNITKGGDEDINNPTITALAAAAAVVAVAAGQKPSQPATGGTSKKKIDKASDKTAAKVSKQANVNQPQTSSSQQGGSDSAPPPPSKQQQRSGPMGEGMASCLQTLNLLKRHEKAGPFLTRVDPIAQSCPDYFKVIKEPMDLSKVEQNLKQGLYQTKKQFADDIQKIWRNSYTYNKPSSVIYKMTQDIASYFDKLFASLQQQQLDNPKQLLQNMPPLEAVYQPPQPAYHPATGGGGGGSKQSSQQRKPSKQNQKNVSQQAESQVPPPTPSATTSALPLNSDEKTWVYKNVARLSPQETATLCSIIQEFCPVKNDSMELNMDTLPSQKGREVLEFMKKSLELVKQQSQHQADHHFESAAATTTATAATASQSTKAPMSQPAKKKGAKQDKMEIPLTMNEKKQLGISIQTLPPEDLRGILNIVQQIQQSDEQIEFDIDLLPVRKARELEQYVKERTTFHAKQLKAQKTSQATASATTSRQHSSSHPQAAASAVNNEQLQHQSHAMPQSSTTQRYPQPQVAAASTAGSGSGFVNQAQQQQVAGYPSQMHGNPYLAQGQESVINGGGFHPQGMVDQQQRGNAMMPSYGQQVAAGQPSVGAFFQTTAQLHQQQYAAREMPRMYQQQGQQQLNPLMHQQQQQQLPPVSGAFYPTQGTFQQPPFNLASQMQPQQVIQYASSSSNQSGVLATSASYPPAGFSNHGNNAAAAAMQRPKDGEISSEDLNSESEDD